MSPYTCASCKFRSYYEKNPKSLLGKIWRWHINWCPGWKKFELSLPEEELNALHAHLAQLDMKRKHHVK